MLRIYPVTDFCICVSDPIHIVYICGFNVQLFHCGFYSVPEVCNEWRVLCC